MPPGVRYSGKVRRLTILLVLVGASTGVTVALAQEPAATTTAPAIARPAATTPAAETPRPAVTTPAKDPEPANDEDKTEPGRSEDSSSPADGKEDSDSGGDSSTGPASDGDGTPAEETGEGGGDPSGRAEDENEDETDDEEEKESRTDSISFVLADTVRFPPLRPGGAVTSDPTAVRVTAAGQPWALAIQDGDAGSPTPGHLRAQGGGGCASGEPTLASPLQVRARQREGSVSANGEWVSLGRSASTVAKGDGSAAFEVIYRQHVGAKDRLGPGCAYAVQLLWTLSGG